MSATNNSEHIITGAHNDAAAGASTMEASISTSAAAAAPPTQIRIPAPSLLPGPQKSKSDLKTEAQKQSHIRPPAASKIGRPCMAHSTPKAGPPPLEPKNGTDAKFNMRRSSEGLKSPLADVCEETENDLVEERLNRSSISPDGVVHSRPPPKVDNRKISNGSVGGDLYLEATGRRRSSDHGVILTTDTDSFIIGQRVWVGGIRPGQIAYIGETHFAPGDWAGVVLDEPNGKNDGCVSGKRYFQCEPKKGIFSRLTRLTHDPLPFDVSPKEQSPGHNARSFISPSRSGTVSPTSSMRGSSTKAGSGKFGMSVGDRVIVSSGLGSRPGILQFIGETKFAQGNWCGIQLDEPTGKNDGSVDGVRYFECPDKYGIFVPMAKVSLSPSSRKTRLSRAGSKESLASVCTLNSVATTNTSRLRLSAQKLGTAAKPATPTTTTKNTYSLQDVIREKQNHIEQLMIERELDREDAQNQAMMYQKNINELKDKVHQLERLLDEERKKSEDLQFSIDEATFCGDETNLQTQAYKEKIFELEKQLQGLTIKDGGGDKMNEKLSTPIDFGQINIIQEENRKLLNEIENLNVKLAESSSAYEKKISENNEQEQTMKNDIENLVKRNNELKADLRSKDENYEKLYLDIKVLQDTYTEEIDGLRKTLKEQEEKNGELINVCTRKETVISQITADIDTMRSNLQKFDNIKNSLEIRCKQLDEESKVYKEKLSANIAEINNLKAIIVSEKDSNKILEEKLKLQESSKDDVTKKSTIYFEENSRLKKEIEIKKNENSALKKQIEQIENLVNQIKHENATLKDELGQLGESKKILEVNVGETSKSVDDFKRLIEELTTKNTLLTKELKENEDKLKSLNKSKESVENENSLLKQSLESKDSEMIELKKNIVDHTIKIEQLSAELIAVQEKLKELTASKNAVDLEILDKNKQITDNNSLLLNLQNQVEILSAKLQEIEQLNQNLTVELENAKLQLQEKETGIGAKQTEINASQTEVQRISTLLAQRDAENEKIKLELDKLQNNLNNSQKKYEELSIINENQTVKFLNEMENYKSQFNEQSKQFSVNLQKLQQEIVELKELNRNLKKAADDKQNEFDLFRENSVGECSKLLENNKKLKVEFESLTSEYGNIQNQSKSAQEKLSELELKHNDLCRRYEALEQKCNEISSQKDSLQQEINALRSTSTNTNSEITRLGMELAAKQKSYEELLDSTNHIKIQLEKSIEEKDRSLLGKAEDIDKLQTNIQNSLAEKSELLQSFETIKQQIESERLKEIARLKSESKTEKASVEALVEEKNKQLSILNSLLEKSLDSLQEQIKELQVEIVRTQLAAKEKEEGLLKQISEICSGQENLWSNLQQQNKRNVLELDSMNFKSLEMDSLKTKISDLYLSLDSTHQLKLPESRLDSLQMEYSVLKTSIDSTMSQSNEFLCQIDSLCQLLKEVEQECKALKLQNDDLQKKMAEAEKEKNNSCNNLQRNVTEKDTTIEKLKAELLESKKEKEVLIEKIAAEESSVKSLQETLSLSTNVTGDLQRELELKSIDLKTKSENLDQLKEQLEQIQREAHEKENEREKLVVELRSSIKQKEDVIRELSEQISHLRNEISESLAKLETMEKEKDDTCNILEIHDMEMDKTITILQEKIDMLAIEKSKQVEKISTLEKSIKEVSDNLDKSTAICESTRMELFQKNEVLNKNELTIKELNDKLMISDAELKDKQKQIEDYQAKLQKEIETKANILSDKHEETVRLQKADYELREKLRLAEDALLAAKKEIDEKSKSIDERNAEVQRINDAQNQLVEKFKKIEDIQLGMQKEIESKTKTINEKQEEILKLRKEIFDLQKTISVAKESEENALKSESEKLTSLSELYNSLQNEHDLCKSEITELNEDLKKRQIELDALKVNLNNSGKDKERLVELQLSFDQQKADNQKMLLEIEKLQQQVKSEQQKVQSLAVPHDGGGDSAASASAKISNEDENENIAQINFLNSIISDMQKKNETLLAHIKSLECIPIDFTLPSAFDMIEKRKPAPRLFCDICEIFDAHDTEDCPQQSSDSPPPSLNPNCSERKIPLPRKYCTLCEVFGHEDGECPNDDETF